MKYDSSEHMVGRLGWYAVALSAAALAAGCSKPGGGGDPVVTVKGAWALGPAAGGTAAAYTLEADAATTGRRHSQFVQVAGDGTFELPVELFEPTDLRICVSPGAGATYSEFGAGVTTALTTDLCADALALGAKGERTRAVSVTAATSFVAALTDALIAHRGYSVAEAHEAARADIEAWLDCLDVGELVDALPYDPQKEGSDAVGLDPSRLVYALTGGFGAAAAAGSRDLDASSGTLLFNSSDIVSVIVADLGDLLLDSRGPKGIPALHEGYEWRASWLTDDLVVGVHRFLLSEHNASGLDIAAVSPHLQCLGATSLFGDALVSVRQPTAPTVVIDTPAPGDVVSSERDVIARAVAEVGPVAEIALRVEHGDVTRELDATLRRLTGGGLEARATLGPAEVGDGPDVVVRATATTEVGHRGEASVGVAVNTAAPALSLSVDGGQPLAEASISGLTQITGVVSDASGIESVTLTVPVEGAIHQEAQGDTDEVITLNVDTTQWLDGTHPVTLEGLDVHGAYAVLTESVLVDNHSDGVMNAYVSLGAPLRDATVVVAERPSGAELGRGRTDETGSARVTLADPGADFVGFVDVSVRGGTTRDLIEGTHLTMQSNDVLRTVVAYEPTVDGAVLDGVQVNLTTTCAANLADVFAAIDKRDSWADNIDYAFRLFGDHLHRTHAPDGPLDIRAVAPADLSVDWSTAAPLSRRVALVHAGVAWDAARHAWRQGRDNREYTILDHMRRLCWQDLGSAKLSGADETGTAVRTVGNGVLTPQSFRHNPAAGIFHWLNGRLPSGESFSQNLTELRGEDFAQSGDSPWGTTDGFLHLLANNTSELFPSDVPPEPLDVVPPSVALLVPETVVTDPRQRVGVRASDGEDGSGLASLTVEVGGVVVHGTDSPTVGETWVDVTVPCNVGFVDVVATAVDFMGIEARDEGRIACDDIAPAVVLRLGDQVADTDSAVPVTGSFTLEATATDPSGVAELVVVGPVGHAVRVSEGRVEISVDTLTWPEGEHTVEVTALDQLGTSATYVFPVLVNNYELGLFELHVALGAPVSGGAATLRELPSGVLLGEGVTDEEGNVRLTVADTSPTYSGHVEVVIRGGEVPSLIGGPPLVLRADDQIRALLPYTPTAAGTRVVNANANLPTTCGAELADVFVRTGRRPTRAENIEYAYHLVADHLSRATSAMGPLDARFVQPSDMTGDWAADTPLRRRSGLAHAGLAWDAARHAFNAGRDIREYTLIDHMNRLCRRDMSSGYLSSRDESGSPVVTVGSEALTANTFRFDTAFGGFKWLNGEMPDGTAFSVNITALRGPDFAQVGDPPLGPGAGYFHSLAGTVNELFAVETPPQVFDAQPPALFVTTPGAEVNTAEIMLGIDASDGEHGTGVVSLVITVDGVVEEELLDVPAEPFELPVAIPCNRDRIRIGVTATDGVGLSTWHGAELACDDRPPAGGFETSQFYQEYYFDAVYSEDGDMITYVARDADAALYDLSPATRQPGVPNVVTKFWDRLHQNSANVPTLSMWFSDTTRAGHSTSDSDLLVTYEYAIRWVVSGETEQIREPTVLPYPGERGFYHLPISYETLSPVMRQTIVQDQHIIRFRARDLVGNETVVDYPFHLHLQSAPVWYGSCEVSPSVSAKTLASDRTHEMDGPGIDIGEGILSYPVHSTTLTQPVHVTLTEAPAFELVPTELRWERDLGRTYEVDEFAYCPDEDFPLFWTFDRQIRGAMRCDTEHMGAGPAVNSVVAPDGAYGVFYWWWEFHSSPYVGLYDANEAPLPQDPSAPSTFLLPAPSHSSPIRINSGTTETTMLDEAYGWDQYELTQEDGSDIDTKRYYFEDGYINVSDNEAAYTQSRRAYIYLSALQAQVRFPSLVASHPELPHVSIPVLVAPDCGTVTLDWEEDIGNRW